MTKRSWSIVKQTDGEETALSAFIKPADETQAAPRPSEIGKFYIESECEHAEDEQRYAYESKGQGESRPAATRTAKLEHGARQAIRASNRADERAQMASTRSGRAHDVLGPHRRRARDGKFLKYLRWALLLGGDIGGITGAALVLGEEPIYAVLQASSAATAAVTLGAVGREVRSILSARSRQKEELTKAEREFESFFSGPNMAEALVKILTLVCAGGILAIAVAIYSLREATEGSAAGITFGLIALALGVASFYNSFDTADDVAELLDTEAANVKKAERAASKVHISPIIGAHAAAKAEAASIIAENMAAGESAAASIRRLLYKRMGESPGVAGNGTGPMTAVEQASTNGHGLRSTVKKTPRSRRS